jgi:methylenetetrahydrofolate dehydrogenase (NADP+)/methenyltetrahydrofolate cyclohydrolase
VTAVVVDGRAEAERRVAALAETVSGLALDPPPTLAIVVAATAEARRNLGIKRRWGEAAGVRVLVDELAVPVTQAAAEAAVDAAAADESVDGVFVQLPLPDGIDPAAVLARIPRGKDVDGPPLGPAAVHSCLVALGLAGVHCGGRRVALVIAPDQAHAGPSPAFVPELAASFTAAGAALVRTEVGRAGWEERCRRGDIVVTAVGRPHVVRGEHLRPGAAVVDAGVSRVDGAVVGDVDIASAIVTAGVIVPSPGGIGPLTVAVLLGATVTASRRRGGQIR